ncbi:MAG: anthranilate phosphoribosyltransferase [Planctomycetota bacterium]
MLKPLLQQLLDGQPLTPDQATLAFTTIMEGNADPAQTGALLGLIQSRGATIDELVGAAKVMRAKAAKVDAPSHLTLIDTCGTGGDHASTFNISTAAAIVAAAVGRPHDIAVAKHGNKSVTSNSGSSQVLETLGVNLHAKPETLTKCLGEAGICFCFAPAHHPAMKHAAPVRAALGFRTIFNLVGPLTNPAGANRQLLGVFAPHLTETLAQVLKQLGADAAMVVHGTIPDPDGKHIDALDELSTAGPSQITELHNHALSTTSIDPSDIGLPYSHPAALHADSPEASAKIITDILAGEHGPPRDIVALNAAAALTVAGLTEDIPAALPLVFEALDSGAAQTTLAILAQLSHDQ